jgi:hypothetical protein
MKRTSLDDFYVDEGTRGMHLIDRHELRPCQGDAVQVSLIFKSRRFGDITYKQDASSRSVFQLSLRKLGYQEMTACHFSRAVISDHGTVRNVLIYKV